MTVRLKYNLDITRTGPQANIDAYQGDTLSRAIFFTISNGTQPFDISGNITAVLYAQKPDGTAIMNNCEIKNGGINVILTTQFTKSAGTVRAQIVLYNGVETIAAPEFNILVRVFGAFPVYEPLTECPSDWSDNYGAYYTKNDGGVYQNIEAESAPVWADGKYYRLSNPGAESENEYGALITALRQAKEALEHALAAEAIINTIRTAAEVGTNRLIISDGKGSFSASGWRVDDIARMNELIDVLYKDLHSLDTMVADKAGYDYVNTELGNHMEVMKLLRRDITNLDALVADKAGYDYVNTELGNHMEVMKLLRADLTNLDALIASKAGYDYVNTEIGNLSDVVWQREQLSNKVTQITSEATDEQYPSSKAVYDAITAERPAAIGHFTDYEQEDVRANKNGWRVLIRQIAPEYVCMRLEHSVLCCEQNTRVFYMYLYSDKSYLIQMNSDAEHGYFSFKPEGGTSPSSYGGTDWWFDRTTGAVEIKLDVCALASLDTVREFTINSAFVRDASNTEIARIRSIYFHLDESSFAIVDSALSSTSKNPVQNKVVNTALNARELSSRKQSSVTSANKNSETYYPRMKAMTGYVDNEIAAERPALIGHFANYYRTDLRYSDEEWQVYIRQTASDRICLRLENSAIVSSSASRILNLYLLGDQRYIMQIYNDAQKGYFDYRVEGSSDPLSAGATDWWFDSDAGYIELLLDISAVAGISQMREFTIVSALLMDYSGSRLAEVKQVYFHLKETVSNMALQNVFSSIANANTIAQIKSAAQNFVNEIQGE